MFTTRLIPLTHLTASPITGLNGKMTEFCEIFKGHRSSSPLSLGRYCQTNFIVHIVNNVLSTSCLFINSNQ